MERHFVKFLSAGTFFHEDTEKPIHSWDVQQAVKMSRDITERYGAKPFAFVFTTRARSDDELDSKVVKRSGRYYLGGKIETIEEIRNRNDPQEQILLANMEGNRCNRVIVTENPWKVTQPLEADDVVLDMSEWTS